MNNIIENHNLSMENDLFYKNGEARGEIRGEIKEREKQQTAFVSRLLRQNLGLSKMQIADIAGVSLTFVEKIEMQIKNNI
jgi:predicted transposase YdaD